MADAKIKWEDHLPNRGVRAMPAPQGPTEEAKWEEHLREKARREAPAGPDAVQQSFATAHLPSRKPTPLSAEDQPEPIAEAVFKIRTPQSSPTKARPLSEVSAVKPRTYSGDSIRVPDPEPTFVRPAEECRPYCVFHGHGAHNTEDCFFNK